MKWVWSAREKLMLATRVIYRVLCKFLVLKFKIVASYHFNLSNWQSLKKWIVVNIVKKKEKKFFYEDFM